MIIIKTHGEYYFKTENLKGRRAFEQEVKAPSLDFFKQVTTRYTGTEEKIDPKTNMRYSEPQFKITEFQNVRGILKKKLLPMLLKLRFPDFVRVRSVTIDTITSSDGESLDLPVQLCSREQLIVMCREKKIPIDASAYLDIDELRFDITEYRTDPEVFLQNQERKNKKRAEEKEFMELNGLNAIEKVSPVPYEVPINPAGVPVSPAAQPATSGASNTNGIADL